MFLQQLLLAPLPWHGASSIHPLTPLHGLDAALGTSLRARRCWQGLSPPHIPPSCAFGASSWPQSSWGAGKGAKGWGRAGRSQRKSKCNTK